MVSMLSAVWISCALVVVALTICSATAVATPKSTSAGVALNMLHSSHAPTAIKRRLKRTTAMEATETSEERAFPVQLPEMTSIFSRLQSVSATISEKIEMWVWRLTRKSSDEVFQLLKLDELAKPNKLYTEEIKLFDDPRFQKWVTFVQKRYSKKSFTAPSEEMLKTLAQYYGNDDTMVKLLATVLNTNSAEDVAKELLWVQLLKMKKDGKTPDELFTLLELENLSDKLFVSPLFLQWVKALRLSNPKDSNEKINRVILSTLDKYYPEQGQLARLLVAGTKLHTTNTLALSLLKTLLSEWVHAEVTMGDIFTFLELNVSREKLFENPRFMLWLNFFNARYQEAYQQGNGAAVRLAKTAYQKSMPGYQATKHTSSTEEEKAKKAEEAFEADTLSFLRKQFNNNDELKSVLDEGSKVDPTEVKKFATKLLQRLNELTTEKS